MVMYAQWMNSSYLETSSYKEGKIYAKSNGGDMHFDGHWNKLSLSEVYMPTSNINGQSSSIKSQGNEVQIIN